MEPNSLPDFVLGHPVVFRDDIPRPDGPLVVEPLTFYRVFSETDEGRLFWGVGIFRDAVEELCETLRQRFPDARVWFEEAAPGYVPDP